MHETIVPPSSFSLALAWLKDGKRCARQNWNASGMWLRLQKPDVGSLMTVPYIYMKTNHGELVPWLASQTDLLADDWYLVNEL